jgi:hypothetical protein
MNFIEIIFPLRSDYPSTLTGDMHLKFKNFEMPSAVDQLTRDTCPN